MNMKLYEVGGCVRDGLLGVTSKDVDYAVDMREYFHGKDTNPTVAYITMNNVLKEQGFEIFLETPSCFTTRAMFPKDHKLSGVADFVMCRKEIGYVPNTRQPIVELGSLYDDLQRRDFTLNAIARDTETGELIDFFGGQEDLKNKTLKCPIDAVTSFNDDPLRILRALRFHITKGFGWYADVEYAIEDFDARKLKVVSAERIYEELTKMFKHDTLKTLDVLQWLKEKNFNMYETIFKEIWIKPTMEKK